MALPTIETVECDILVVGGGMSGCGAAFESKYWGEDLKVVIVEKAVIERSGATGEGLSAINCYMGQRYGWNTPEDFVKYVVNDMMGLAREDLVYDVGRHVDSSVHLLEEWGLPIWKKENGETFHFPTTFRLACWSSTYFKCSEGNRKLPTSSIP